MIQSPEFAPGFRLSGLDIGVLMIGGMASLVLGAWSIELGLVCAFTVAHFFLFCNVLRMARFLELLWASAFLLLAGATIHFDVPGWAVTYGGILFVTVLVSAVQLRLPSYHGVGWQRVNPGLPNWWAAYRRWR